MNNRAVKHNGQALYGEYPTQRLSYFESGKAELTSGFGYIELYN